MNQSYEKAIELYSQAIENLGETDPNCAAYFCNRSMCYLKLDKFGAVLEDAEKSISADPKFIKGYYRKSQGLFGLGKMKDAKKALLYVTKVLKINNKDIKERIQVLTSIIREQEFFESIQYESEIEKLDAEKLVVP